MLHRALEPLPHVNAAWLGGSDAFGRADELSFVADLDDLAAKLPKAERLLRELLDSLPGSRPREPGGGGS